MMVLTIMAARPNCITFSAYLIKIRSTRVVTLKTLSQVGDDT